MTRSQFIALLFAPLLNIFKSKPVVSSAFSEKLMVIGTPFFNPKVEEMFRSSSPQYEFGFTGFKAAQSCFKHLD